MVYNKPDPSNIKTVTFKMLPSKLNDAAKITSILPDQPSTQIHSLNLESKSSEELLPRIRPSRKGTRLNDAEEFNAPPPQAREKILCESLLKFYTCSIGLPLRKIDTDVEVMEYTASNTQELSINSPFPLLQTDGINTFNNDTSRQGFPQFDARPGNEKPSGAAKPSNKSPSAPKVDERRETKTNYTTQDTSSDARPVYTDGLEDIKDNNPSPSDQLEPDSVPQVADLIPEQQCSINSTEMEGVPFSRDGLSGHTRNNEMYFTELTSDDKILRRSFRESSDRYNSLIRPDLVYTEPDIYDETETSPHTLVSSKDNQENIETNLQSTERDGDHNETATDIPSSRTIRISYRGKQLFITKPTKDGQSETIIYPDDEIQNKYLENNQGSSVIEITFRRGDKPKIDQNIQVSSTDPILKKSEGNSMVNFFQVEEINLKENGNKLDDDGTLKPSLSDERADLMQKTVFSTDDGTLERSLSDERSDLMQNTVFSPEDFEQPTFSETVGNSKQGVPQRKKTSRSTAVHQEQPVNLVETSTAQESEVRGRQPRQSNRQSEIGNSGQYDSAPVTTRKSFLRFSQIPTQSFIYSTSVASEGPWNRESRGRSGLCPCAVIVGGAKYSRPSQSSQRSTLTRPRQQQSEVYYCPGIEKSNQLHQEYYSYNIPGHNVEIAPRQERPTCTCDNNRQGMDQKRWPSTINQKSNVNRSILNGDFPPRETVGSVYKEAEPGHSVSQRVRPISARSEHSENRSSKLYSVNQQSVLSSRMGDGKQFVSAPKSRTSNFRNTVQDNSEQLFNDYSKRKSFNVNNSERNDQREYRPSHSANMTSRNASVSVKQKSIMKNSPFSQSISAARPLRLSDLADFEIKGNKLIPPRSTSRYSRVSNVLPQNHFVYTTMDSNRIPSVKPPKEVSSRQDVLCQSAGNERRLPSKIGNPGASGEGWAKSPIATYPVIENPQNTQSTSQALDEKRQIDYKDRNRSINLIYSASTLPENSSGDASLTYVPQHPFPVVNEIYNIPKDRPETCASNKTDRKCSSVRPLIHSTVHTEKINQNDRKTLETQHICRQHQDDRKPSERVVYTEIEKSKTPMISTPHQDTRQGNESVMYASEAYNEVPLLTSQFPQERNENFVYSSLVNTNQSILPSQYPQCKCQERKIKNESVVYTSIVNKEESLLKPQNHMNENVLKNLSQHPPCKCQERKIKNESFVYTSIVNKEEPLLKPQNHMNEKVVNNEQPIILSQYPPCKCQERKIKNESFVYTSIVNKEEPPLKPQNHMNENVVKNEKPIILSQYPPCKCQERMIKNESVVYTSIVNKEEPPIKPQNHMNENVVKNEQSIILPQHPPCKCQERKTKDESVVYTTVVNREAPPLIPKNRMNDSVVKNISQYPPCKCRERMTQNECVVYTSIVNKEEPPLKPQNHMNEKVVNNEQPIILSQYPPCKCQERKIKNESFVYTSIVNKEEPPLKPQNHMNENVVKNEKPIILSQYPPCKCQERMIKNESFVYTSIVNKEEPPLKPQNHMNENVVKNEQSIILPQHPPCKCQERMKKNGRVVYTSIMNKEEPRPHYEDHKNKNVNVLYPSVVKNEECIIQSQYPPCKCQEHRTKNDNFLYTSIVSNEESRLPSLYQDCKKENGNTPKGGNEEPTLQSPYPPCKCGDHKTYDPNFEYPSMVHREGPPLPPHNPPCKCEAHEKGYESVVCPSDDDLLPACSRKHKKSILKKKPTNRSFFSLSRK